MLKIKVYSLKLQIACSGVHIKTTEKMGRSVENHLSEYFYCELLSFFVLLALLRSDMYGVILDRRET